ncbi:MAG: NUDIX hydrolase [Acholeplasmataceae bacterium]
MDYITAFESYRPINEQEEVEQQAILDFIYRNQDALFRTNLVAHVTASAIITNEAMDRMLFVYHNIYNSWSWVGGHNDGDPDLLAVAIREAKEETGLKRVEPYSQELFMVDQIYVENHVKRGKFVPDHLHLNGTYLLIADERDALAIKDDENSGVRWFDIESILDHVSEPRMLPIYKRAIRRIERIRRNRDDRTVGDAS